MQSIAELGVGQGFVGVELSGLSAKPELNGRTGVIKKYDEAIKNIYTELSKKREIEKGDIQISEKFEGADPPEAKLI